ncbi:MAG: hypothetical protein IKY45_01240 [Clostridia bacterium]|nr:hypothetical protein [Clostridia bacterium]
MEEFKIKATDKMAHIEESLKAAHKRIDSIDNLTKSVYELASSIKTMQTNIADMSGRIKVIEEKPAKRWDLVITTALTTIVGVIVGYFFKM